MLLDQINVRNGLVIVNRLSGDKYDLDIKNFLENENLLEIRFGSYVINVRYQNIGVYNVFILKDEQWTSPIVKQEVGDFESLVFTLQNYIDLLASFNEIDNRRRIGRT